MEWSTDEPTSEGWYWAWDGKDICMVEVWGNADIPIAAFAHNFNRIELDTFTHWIGPLPKPKAPEEKTIP